MTKVHIVLGSASDLGAIKASGIVQTLSDIGITVALSVCSAHRNLPELENFAHAALKDGAKVFIGVAGMAAALPGALAGLTGMSIPIIGVPLDEHGINSCLYMPPGVPVLLAGVGSAGLKNAGLAAAQILAANDSVVAGELSKHLVKSKKSPSFDINITEDAS
jgi:phosphoribosylaminoimidazole carboxylase PurE protein